MVLSGVYDCQLVLVVKLAAVFQARSGPTAARCCGFQGQEGLQALDGVGEQQGYGREAQHGEGVFAPVHLLVGLDGAELVDEPLDGAKDGRRARCARLRARAPGRCRRGERWPAGRWSRWRIAASRSRTCQNFSGKSRETVRYTSKRTERTRAIAEIQSHVHGLPQLLARLDVEERHGEEGDGEQKHHWILHAQISRCVRTGSKREAADPPKAILRCRRYWIRKGFVKKS